jgi:UDP-D-galactose:(glucosyl)LPS alpha-1,6-D-galactosyltransferase
LQLVGRVVLESDHGKLEALAGELGIADRIDWLGWQSDPWAALNCADLLVLCTAFEGFPMILIEAIARGIPCLSSDCPTGPSDIIVSGQSGWLFPVEDIESMAERIQAVIDDRLLLPHPKVVSATAEPFSSRRSFLNFRRAIEATMLKTRT